jgi:hypothetical protein
MPSPARQRGGALEHASNAGTSYIFHVWRSIRRAAHARPRRIDKLGAHIEGA